MVLVALSLTACTTQQTTDINRTAVVGAVYDEVGRHVVGAHITFGIRRGITDAAGRFRIENLRPGRYDVTVVAEGPRPARFHRDRTVPDAVRTDPTDLSGRSCR
jgi:uncharacterized protein with GYD domain